MHKWIAVCFVLISLICLASATIDITTLSVPKAVSLADNDDIILDCVYTVTDKQGLVIKWFLDKDEQVYQWIPATRRPQAMGRLKDRLDLEYKATNDLYTMYRALKIKEVTKELAGIYSCKVSSFENEDVESAKMVVYQPASDIEMTHDEEEDTLICNAQGVYPKPKMNIFVRDQDGDDDDDDDDDDNNNKNKKDDDDDDDDDDDKKKKKRRTTKRADKDGDGKDDDDDHDDDDDDDNSNNTPKKTNDNNGTDDDGDDDDDDDDDDDSKDANSNEDEDLIELEEDGTYNITSVYKYDENSLKEPVVFICELYIPDTDYKVLEKIAYVPDNYEASTSKSDTQLESSIATNDDSSEEENGVMATAPVSILVIIVSVAFILRHLLL